MEQRYKITCVNEGDGFQTRAEFWVLWPGLCALLPGSMVEQRIARRESISTGNTKNELGLWLHPETSFVGIAR